MKIIIFVDFSNENFNKDFSFSNALIGKGHTVLFVNSFEQLNSAYMSYDLLIYGYSYSNDKMFDKITSREIKDVDIENL